MSTLSIMDMADTLAVRFRWFDRQQGVTLAKEQTFRRIAKVAGEAGELVEEYMTLVGANALKNPASTSVDHVADELVDVLITALVALVHLKGDQYEALDHWAHRMDSKLRQVNEAFRKAQEPEEPDHG